MRLALGDEAAGKMIVEAVVRNQGSRDAAAAELKLASTTFYRLVAELQIGDDIDKACLLLGVAKRGARARGKVPREARKAIRNGRHKAK